MFDEGEKKSMSESTGRKKGAKKEKSNERNENSEIEPEKSCLIIILINIFRYYNNLITC